MQLLMQIDHMQLVYFTAALALILIALGIHLNLSRQLRETRALSASSTK